MRGARKSEAGFTLLESLVVIVIVSILVMTAVSLANERLRASRVQVAASQFAIHLKAARLAAVSHRQSVDVVVGAGFYEFTDHRGQLRRIELPSGVEVVSSNSPITFRPNGAVTGGATTVMQATLSGSLVDRWTIDTSVIGLARTSHQRLHT